MRVGRRRVAVVATVLVAVAAGTGVARAYYAPGAKDLTSATGYFTFCADRQRDIAGIVDGDLGPTPTGANYHVDGFVYDTPGALVGQTLASDDPFVLSKSGIQAEGSARRVLTTERIEYADAAHTSPVQVRCKMRTHESLVRPETDKQRFDDNSPSTVPWGFGTQAATAPPKTCRQVQDELVATVWNSLTAAEKSASPYQYGTPSLVLGPDNNRGGGPAWTPGIKIVSASAGVLTIADWTLQADSTAGSVPDRLLGAHYCVFVAPDYLRGVLLGGPVV